MTTGNEPTIPAEPPDGPARDARGHFTRTTTTAERDAQAADLRANGWKLKDIATELGYHDASHARQAIQRALQEIVRGPAEKLIALHVERLETLYEAALEILEADHVLVSHGHIITMLDPETGVETPLKDNGPKLAAIREARATMESFRKLMGLDQPTQVNVSGGVRYEVVGVDPAELT